MGLFSRWFNRSNPENPATSLADPDIWLFTAFGAQTSAASVNVTPLSALEVTSVWAAVRVISSTIASLPLITYRETQDGKERDKSHRNYRLLHDRPNPEMSSFTWRETSLGHVLLYGNAYSEIERNGAGEPVALWPIHPMNVDVIRRNGHKLYVVTIPDTGEKVPLSPDNMLHIPGFSLDGCKGLFPVSLARDAIGLAKATEQFGSKFFANGARPDGVIMYPGKLGPTGSANLETSFNAKHQGLSQAHRIKVLEEGAKYLPMGIAPEHAQFLETRRFQVDEVARVFGIPPHLIASLDRATFSNIEAQGIEFVQYCIGPWCTRIEQEANWKLFGHDSMHYAEFLVDGLLRGDSAARSAYYTAALTNGWMSPNEVREREGMNRVPGGDVLRAPLNLAPLTGSTNDNE